MPHEEEPQPGDRAPATDHYEGLNIIGTRTGKVAHVIAKASHCRKQHVGSIVVVRPPPLVDGEPQYRVRSEADGLDRVVLERQIRLVEEERGVSRECWCGRPPT